MADTPARLAGVFRAANVLVRPLLQSRLHPALSSRLMLLSYSGGKTGHRYTFPVGYFRWDDREVLTFSTQGWPAHIRRAGGIRLLIRGHWHEAVPTVITEDEAKADLIADFTQHNGPRAAKGLMLGLPGDRQPDRHELLTAAAKTTITRFALTS